MNNTRPRFSEESLDRIRNLFEPDSLWTVEDLTKATSLSKTTIRAVLKTLVLTKFIKEAGYKQKIGKVYAPVAQEDFALRVGKDPMTFPALISYIQSTDKSPFDFISDDKWIGIRQLFLQVVFTDFSDNVKPEPLKRYMDKMQEQMGELLRMIVSFNSDQFWSVEGRSKLNAVISAEPGAVNTYEDLMNKFREKRAS